MEQELFSTAQIAAELEHKSKNPNRDVLNIAKRLGFTPAATRPREGKNPGGKPEMLWNREQKDAILADNRNRHKEPAQIDSPVKEPHDVSETSPADVTPEQTDATAKHADCVSKSQTIEVKCVKSNLPPTLAKTAFFIDVKPAPVVEEITLAQRADRIRSLQADVQRGIIQIGFELIAAKEQVGHGNWSTWLETEFKWTQQTANRFMRVAERFGKLNNVVQFQPSILQAMLLLPEGDEQEFIDAQAAAGTPVETQSARDVQKHVKEFKAARADVSAEETDDRDVVSEPVTQVTQVTKNSWEQKNTTAATDADTQNFAELIIDEEFSNILPPLKEYEFNLLEENILRDGILDPLKVWNGILLDGHARYEIAKRHNLPFKIVEVKSVTDRDDAIIWIIKNQLARRSLNQYERAQIVLKLQNEPQKKISPYE